MTISQSIGQTPILMANPGMLAYFEKYTQDFLLEMERKKERTRAVTRLILSRLDDETVTKSIDKHDKRFLRPLLPASSRIASFRQG